AYEATVRRLEGLGARLIDVRMPHHELVVRTIMWILNVESSLLMDNVLGDRPRVFSPAVERLNEYARTPDVAGCIRAQENRQLVTRDYQLAFSQVDVLVLPTVPITAPAIGGDELPDAARCTAYTGAANLVGAPSVPLPAGMANGLPLSVQIMAAPGNDAVALRVAYALEQAAPEHRVQTPGLDG